MRRKAHNRAPLLGMDDGDLTVDELYEEEGETGPGQRRERKAREAQGRRAGQQALSRLAKAARQEKQQTDAVRRRRK